MYVWGGVGGGHEFQEHCNCKKSRVGGPGLCELAKRNPSLNDREPRETEAAWGMAGARLGARRDKEAGKTRGNTCIYLNISYSHIHTLLTQAKHGNFR